MTSLLGLVLMGCEARPVARCTQSDAVPIAHLAPDLESVSGGEAANALLRRLRGLSEEDSRLLLGQSAGHADYLWAETHAYATEGMEEAVGARPAILQVDLGYAQPTPETTDQAVQDAIAHWNAGGLVTLSNHVANPITQGDIRDRSYPAEDFGLVLDPDSEAHARWLASLDAMAGPLGQLQDAGVVVLWRPFHEMNGSWWWYSTNRDDQWTAAEDFRALWRLSFERLTQEHGLDNLLWVYAANVQLGENVHDSAHFYPGDDWVDVVALDLYAPDLSEVDRCGSLNRLLALDKPLGLAELGPDGSVAPGAWDASAVLELAEAEPRLVFATAWHDYETRLSTSTRAWHSNENAQALVDDPLVLTLEDAPRGE
ncbi:MAG: glycosyl hydrolase [Myxococcota bacterium]|nr:glycosyl hydrolase [Myxococcota bacterium]